MPTVVCPARGNETATMTRLRPTNAVKPLKICNAHSFVLFFHLLQCLKFNQCCLSVSKMLQKGKKEIWFCPKCDKLCRSVTSSNVNIGLAFN